MAAFFYYASFPNSRVKPRPSTTQAITYQVPIVDYTLAPTLVVVADANRTYMLLENLSLTTGCWYIYAREVLADPTATATAGSTGQMVIFGGVIYQKNDDGITTDWTIVAIEDVGEFIGAQQTAELDSPESVYVSADSNVAVVPAVVIGVDRGAG